MKKLLSFVLVFLMLFGLSACDNTAQLLSDAAEIVSELEEIASAEVDISDSEAETDTTEPSEESAQDTTTEEAVTEETTTEALTTEEENALDEDGIYTTKEDVALYIHLYGKLPKNFMTKSEARKLGWEGGSLEPYAPNMCIGGDYFGNYEELLPTDRTYRECDIDTLGAKSRGAKRLVFSDGGLIYYTDDHYETFELLYGEP